MPQVSRGNVAEGGYFCAGCGGFVPAAEARIVLDDQRPPWGLPFHPGCVTGGGGKWPGWPQRGDDVIYLGVRWTVTGRLARRAYLTRPEITSAFLSQLSRP